jgi:manganese-dependent inorganic pyrophosphatase
LPPPTYIFGHRNPDADAICSALAYADYKGHTDPGGRYQPARCGNSNVRIDAILDRFRVSLPPFMGDVTPRLREQMSRDLVTVGPEATLAEALELIDHHDIQVLPVVEDGNRLKGMVSIFQLGQSFVPRAGLARDVRKVVTSLRAIARALKADPLHLEDGDRVEELVVRVGAMDIRSFDRVQNVEEVDPGRTVVVVGDRWDIQQRSIQRGIRLLVISGGLEVEEELVERARDAGVSLMVSPYDSATTAWTIRAATRVEAVMGTEVVEFPPEETVESVRRRTATLDPAVFMVTGDDGRLQGVFTRRDILRPTETRIILVDHNELSQAVAGAEQVQVVEVVDHHRLGDLRTEEPILFLNRPVGSTCTIIADLYRAAGLTPSPAMAGIMMGGLVSDTLNLRSPTTTRVDEDVLRWLEGIAGLTGSELAETIFSSGSVVVAHSPDEVVALDRKLYEEGTVRFAISQVEELGFDEFWKRADDLAEALARTRAREDLAFAALLVTDVKTQNSLLLVSGDREVVAAIPYPVAEEDEVFRLDGVVSRKKQVLPLLSGILKGVSG